MQNTIFVTMNDSHAYPNTEMYDCESYEFITPVKRKPDANTDDNSTTATYLEASPYYVDSVEDSYSQIVTNYDDDEDGSFISHIEFLSPFLSTVDVQNIIIKSPEILVSPPLSPIGRNISIDNSCISDDDDDDDDISIINEMNRLSAVEEDLSYELELFNTTMNHLRKRPIKVVSTLYDEDDDENDELEGIHKKEKYNNEIHNVCPSHTATNFLTSNTNPISSPILSPLTCIFTNFDMLSSSRRQFPILHMCMGSCILCTRVNFKSSRIRYVTTDELE